MSLHLSFHRLTEPAAFERLKTSGRTLRHPLLMLGYRPNELAFSRVGFIVSKRVGNAVIRNRARRLLREAARHAYTQLVPGFDLVLIARNEIVGKSYTEVMQALDELFARAKLWQPRPIASRE